MKNSRWDLIGDVAFGYGSTTIALRAFPFPLSEAAIRVVAKTSCNIVKISSIME